jgi:uncharacterized protein
MTDKKGISTLPTSENERLIPLDILRGFAVLGILIMNIQSFSMISVAYINPAAYGDLTGINKWTWILSHLFADVKFITLFSIMFGAGIVLFTDRMQAKSLRPLNMHYRRIFWLLLFGLIHAYLIWYGDVLVAYAVCGIFIILFRKLQARWLLFLGMFFITIPSLLYLFFGFSWDFIPPEGQAGISVSWWSTPEKIAEELRLYRSGWLDQMQVRIPGAITLQTFVFPINIGWRAGGAMLLGMAFFKWDIITGRKSNKFYIIGAVAGLIVGIPIIITGIYMNFSAEWTVNYSMFLGWQYNYWGSLIMAVAYLFLIMLLSKYLQNTLIGKSFASVGRMAFTNYIMQSLICTIVFYGHGFGLYGLVDRYMQIIIVFFIWIVQLIYSPISRI